MKYPIGRPPEYESPEQMEEAIAEYFNDEKCDFTITGLALSLGFCSRQSIYDYAQKPEYSYIIKKAQSIIEHSHEINLRSNNVTGSIFALKNMGWSDKTEVDQKTEIQHITYKVLPKNE